jgi:hypothetical protein
MIVTMMITLGGIAGIAGMLLAFRYAVLVLVPAGLVAAVVIVAGCVGNGVNVVLTSFAVLCGLICLNLGYLLRLVVPQLRRSAAPSFRNNRTPKNRLEQSEFGRPRPAARLAMQNVSDSRFGDVGVSAREAGAPENFEIKSKRPIVDVP